MRPSAAFSYPKLREGILRTEQADAALTAIVESELEREDDAMMFALETLSAAGSSWRHGGAAEDCGERAAADGL